MNPISAFSDRAISNSSNPNKAWYLILVVAAFAFSGCGEDEKTDAQKLAEGATSSVGPSGSTTAQGGTTAEGSEKPGKDKKQSSTKSQPKKPSNPNEQIPNSEKPQTKTDSAEPTRMALTINLKNGKFAETTPLYAMVPTEIDVDLDVYVQDSQSYTLAVTKAKQRATESPIFPGKGFYTYSIGQMAEGQVATVKLGKKTIEIKAGAEPGP